MSRPSVPSGLRRNTLSTPGLFLLAVSASAPATAVLGGVVSAVAIGGPSGVPASFIVLTVALLLFGVGYVSVGQHARHAGPLYAYVARGLGRVWGMAAAAVALLAYNAIEICLFGFLGVTVASFWGGQWWAWALPGSLVIGLFGMAHVRITARVLAVLLCFDLATVITFIAFTLTHPVDGQVAWGDLWPGRLLGDPSGGVDLALGVACFVGVELPMAFSEEATSHTTMRRATFGAMIFLGVLYALAGLAVIAATGAADAQQDAASLGAQLVFTVVHQQLGPVGLFAAQAFLCSSMLAAQVSFHQTAARYTFALHREGILRGGLAGRVNLTSGAPVGGSLIQSGVALVVIVVWATARLDPMLLFTALAALAALGIMGLIMASCLATIGFYERGKGSGRLSLWVRWIAPVAGAAAMLIIVGETAANMHALAGIPEHSPWRWLLPALVLFTALGGAGWGLALRLQDKHALDRLGEGEPEPLAVPAHHLMLDGRAL